MRTSLMDFTRGSQIAETVAMMFGTALRPMLLTALAIMAGIIGWLIWTESQPRDGYYWLMHLYASSWLWMEFNPQKLLGLKTLTEGTIMVHIADVTSYPPLQAAWLRLWSAVSGGVMYGSLIGVPLAMVSTVVLRKFGHGLTERKHKRGAQLASAEQLRADVIAFNLETGADDRAADKRRILGRGAWHKAPLWTKHELIEAGMYEPFTLAGIPYPWRAEQSHTMLVGTTGTGKSTVMKDLLKQIRARRGRAVVFDLTATFIETFYNPHTDIILNPFDARCPKWSPFSDAHTREHFKEASLALVPMSDGGGEQFWPESARMIFVETCVRLVEQGRGNAQALSDVLMTSKLKDLHAHVLRTVAAPLTDPEAKRMAESIRATFNTYAQALLTLPTEGRDFSVRDWVLASDDPSRRPQPAQFSAVRRRPARQSAVGPRAADDVAVDRDQHADVDARRPTRHPALAAARRDRRAAQHPGDRLGNADRAQLRRGVRSRRPHHRPAQGNLRRQLCRDDRQPGQDQAADEHPRPCQPGMGIRPGRRRRMVRDGGELELRREQRPRRLRPSSARSNSSRW